MEKDSCFFRWMETDGPALRLPEADQILTVHVRVCRHLCSNIPSPR